MAVTSLGSAQTAAGSTITLTVTAVAAIGDYVVVVVSDQQSSNLTAQTLVDSSGNTWTLLAARWQNNTSASGNAFFLYGSQLTTALTSGTSTIVFTPEASGVGGRFNISGTKVTGVASTPLDSAVTAIFTGSGNAPSLVSGTPAEANEVFIAAINYGPSAFTQDSNWASPPVKSESNGGCNIAGGNLSNAGTGTETFAPSLSGSVSWAGAIIGLKTASAVPFINKSWEPPDTDFRQVST